jgi:hypothetical protein
MSQPYPSKVGWNNNSAETHTPWISIVLNIVGVLALFMGVIGVYAGFQDSGSTAETEIGIGCAGIIGGFVFFGMASGLQKLHQIEMHLRK